MSIDVQPDDKYIVNSLRNGLALLELFGDTNATEMSLSQISERLGINKSSAYRLLFTLDNMGYIKKDQNKNYKLGIKAVDLSYAYLNSISYKQEAYCLMQELRDKTGTAVHLFTLDGIDVVSLHNIQPLGVFSSNILPGLRWPAYATVIGQILLSSLSDDEIRERYQDFTEWKIYSDATPSNLNELIKLIHKARESQYMISWQKFNSDMVAGAAPIKDVYSNKIVYALSVSCPANLFSVEHFEKEIMSQVVESSKKLSKIYKPEYNW